VNVEDLLAQYQQKTGVLPSGLGTFLKGLTEAGAAFETAQITQEADSSGYRVTVVTSLGLAIVQDRYERIPPRVVWSARGVLHDWRSVGGVELTLEQKPDEDPVWTLTVRDPEPGLTIKDRDGAKTRALAAAILRHVSPS
jgi:hypothetical protein